MISSDVEAESIQKALKRCKELKINFLALDFDQTILQIHTGGNWKGTAEELLTNVRPIFRDLIPAALDEGMHVAVVTFSTQLDKIRYILDELTNNRAGDIPIRGGFAGRTFDHDGKGSTEGKQAHMASAAEELEARNSGLKITRETTLLVDDDTKNIRFALQNGVRAIWLNPQNATDLLEDMKNLV
eukprot:CAMPEP_0194144984 /NCGR_PEP_ID=MMETSP0152-20130528/13925_1 /TAXON_ID=1049557 /ORGANISM="Thalassiothrix antarctica, Strain L6-D1" /LENGTH=185 /DNA_ID=CAMNT_0038845011 /DNA_START=99 /DNA_END=656 /DNA_ORIENTATION=-